MGKFDMEGWKREDGGRQETVRERERKKERERERKSVCVSVCM